MNANDLKFIKVAIDVAHTARENGNHPFGAILVNEEDQIILKAENTVITERDCTGHAETNLIRKASGKFDRELLAHCTLYTSTEPCPMCAGAIYWGNVGRVVYGLSQKGLYEMSGQEIDDVLYLPCREILEKGAGDIKIVGPILEEEAKAPHKGFWV